jgi:hypothetical protein
MAAVDRAGAMRGWMAAVAAEGWHGATVQQAAAATDVAPADIVAALGDKIDALAALLDGAALAAADAAARAAAPREALFDGIMAGLDALQAERAAALAIWRSRDPGALAMLAGRGTVALRRLASAAGLPVTGLAAQPRLLALAAVGAKALAEWAEDDSADLSRTMAALDRLLERAEQAETKGLLSLIPGIGSFAPGLSRPGD